MFEQRGSRRTRVLKSAEISFGGSAISCTVRNFSEGGAQLAKESPHGIPTEFKLVIPSRRRVAPFSGHLAGRQSDRAAVRGGRTMKLSHSLSSVIGIPAVPTEVDAMNVGKRAGRPL